jgi:hypothetical protein
MVEPTFCSLTRRVFGSDLEWFKRHILLAGQAESRTVFIAAQSSRQFFADVGRMSQDTCHACKYTESS